MSYRIDLFDLLAVQGTLKSLLQHHSLKASFLWHPAFFMVISHILLYVNSHKSDYWINHNFDYMDLHTSVYFGEAGLPALSMFWAEQLYIIKERVPICEII